MTPAEFPLQFSRRKSIPWAMIAPHEQQARRNHGQSLSTLAARHGLDATEAVAVLTGQGWPGYPDPKADEKLEALVAAWLLK